MNLPDMCVVDTNVPVVANLAASPDPKSNVPIECVDACIEAVVHVMDNKALVLDADNEIFDEYLNNLAINRQPGIGDQFMKWVHDHFWPLPNSHRVPITKDGEPYVGLLDHPQLAKLNKDDRKFIAVANAHPDKPPILQAMDSKWRDRKAFFDVAGITVLFLYRDYVSSKSAKTTPIKTRFAPSPTGDLHVGGARTALFSWLLAKQQGGTFVLRIEDTDHQRSTQQSTNAILQAMQWLGLDYDEGPYYQSQRSDRYQAAIQKLLSRGHAYHCDCSKQTLDAMRQAAQARGEKPKYNGKCRNRTTPPAPGTPTVIRFKNPQQGKVTFHDLIKGRITISNTELDDLIIARSDGTPTYNLTVVVDDLEMGITHVIRGDDHINNTPRQINILHALGVEPPIYAHVPMVLDDDGKRLSKRHAASSVMQYAADGYLPEALLNHLVRLGWSHGDQEIFTKKEMIDKFNLKSINTAPATFNTQKLQWLNQHYIKQAAPTQLAHELAARLPLELATHLAQVQGIRPPQLTIPDLAAKIAEALRESASEFNQRLAQGIRPPQLTIPDLAAKIAEALRESASEFNQRLAQGIRPPQLTIPDLAAKIAEALRESASELNQRIAEALRERVTTMAEMAQKATMFYRDYESLDPQAATKHLHPQIAAPLRAFHDHLQALTDWQPTPIQALLESTTTDFNLSKGKLWPAIRLAITGTTISPPINQTIYLLGKDRTLRGLNHALQYIKKTP